MNTDIRNLSKWLNEEQEAPIDRQALARVLVMAEQPAQQEPVALETVYETIIQWDEGCGKRSRRELARRIAALYTAPPAQRKPLTIGEVEQILAQHNYDIHGDRARYIVRMTEAAHNIKDQP